MSYDSARRRFLRNVAAGSAAAALPIPQYLLAQTAPAIVTAPDARPQLPSGVQSGDPLANRAMVWSRCDRPARMWVEWATRANFHEATRVRGPYVLETSDYVGALDLVGLPEDADIFYRVLMQDLSNERVFSEPVHGHLRTAPSEHGHRRARNVKFVWGGDTAGQGYGINPDFGGMRIYAQMQREHPDFFIHSGDTIYADGPIEASRTAPDGSIWRNLVTEEVSKVAETLNEFRGRYRYNMMDTNVRAFNSEVAQIWQWDDHEVTNNWSDSKDLSADLRYMEKNVPLLIARGTKAFLEYAPLRHTADVELERVYRHIPYGALLDIFVVDMRSYRGPNTFNQQAVEGADTAFLGSRQFNALKRGLKSSRAVWKVIAADMPIGLNIGDGIDAQGRARWEAIANGEDGAASGRELEIARLLSFIKREGIGNVVWVTADVHYAAAHFYDPRKAAFTDFSPFWEFVAGPLNAGSFGPNAVDGTFGLQVVYQNTPPAPNTAPSAGFQFYGVMDIDSRTREMKVSLKNLAGTTIFTKVLEPRRG